MIAVIDCNNFFVSCERLFNPSLHNKPVVVLSNNDGCAISRSNEVKDLGIKMGQPYFEFEHLVKLHDITVFSTNFSLYSDISRRIMNELVNFAEEYEIYSVDEIFIKVPNTVSDYEQFAKKIRDTILKNIGIPVSVGIARTKTLAKIAVEQEKRNKGYYIIDSENLDNTLKQIELNDIWGIGNAFANKIANHKIMNALDFKRLDAKFIKSLRSINLHRTYLELNEIECYNILHVNYPKSISHTRSFFKGIKLDDTLLSLFSEFTADCAFKLRRKKSVCTNAMVFFVNSVNGKREYVSNSFNFAPTQFENKISKYINEFLQKKIKKKNNSYNIKRIGITLFGIYPEDEVTQNFLDPIKDSDKKIYLAIDKLNLKYHRQLVHSGGINLRKKYKANRKHESQKFTSDWNEILTIK